MGSEEETQKSLVKLIMAAVTDLQGILNKNLDEINILLFKMFDEMIFHNVNS